jgi:urea transporter
MREFFSRWIQGTLRGIGQVMLQENAMTGLCFLLGIAIDSFWMALGTVLGVVVSMATAAILGWNSKGIHAGIYGFNGALVGVAGFFGVEHAARIVLALCSLRMVLCTLLQNLSSARFAAFKSSRTI